MPENNEKQVNVFIRRILIQPELELHDAETGKLLEPRLLKPIPMYEASFPPGLLEWLTEKGLKLTEMKHEEIPLQSGAGGSGPGDAGVLPADPANSAT